MAKLKDKSNKIYFVVFRHWNKEERQGIYRPSELEQMSKDISAWLEDGGRAEMKIMNTEADNE